MRIVYLESTRDDILWMRRYYRQVFPQGARRAFGHLKSSEQLLGENPYIGHPLVGKNIRELSIKGTPFSFLYRVHDDRIEVVRIWDGRGNRDRL